MIFFRLIASIVQIAGLTIGMPCYGQAGTAEPECRFTESDLIGAWWTPAASAEIVENDGHQLDFELEDGVREVREFLHHRPFGSRTWLFENCRIRVISDNGSEEHFRLEGKANPILVANPDGPADRAVYTKIEEDAATE